MKVVPFHLCRYVAKGFKEEVVAQWVLCAVRTGIDVIPRFEGFEIGLVVVTM
jgi:hypothetical protein